MLDSSIPRETPGEVPREAPREAEDALEAIEVYYRQGWTDGLPVVPPTEASVSAMLHAARLAPDQVIGRVSTRRRTLTAEKVAINAVMSGCLPEYMPVVVTAIEALCDPAFSVHGPSASTSGQAILLIVNGPVASRLGINGGENCFGPGIRANATIGRAIRLILMNGLGALPRVLDRSVFGHPGKFTYCIAENEAESPWPPLHVERGCPPGSSAVTVFAAEAPHQVTNGTARSPEEILSTVADTMSVAGRLTLSGQEFCVVVGPQHMSVIAKAGWGKGEIRRFLRERAQRSALDLRRAGRLPGAIAPGDAEKLFSAVLDPDDILVVAAGGWAGSYSAVIAGWAGRDHSRAVTKVIRE